MGVVGILLALALLMFMAYRGFSVIFFAPIFAILAAVFSGMAVLPTYTEIFLPALANYVKIFFPFFLLGAKRAMLSVVRSAAVLTYGGVSLFVVAFAVYPFAASIFKEADIPKRLIPGRGIRLRMRHQTVAVMRLPVSGRLNYCAMVSGSMRLS